MRPKAERHRSVRVIPTATSTLCSTGRVEQLLAQRPQDVVRLLREVEDGLVEPRRGAARLGDHAALRHRPEPAEGAEYGGLPCDNR